MVSLTVAKEVKVVDMSKATKIKVGFMLNSSGAKTKSLFDAPIDLTSLCLSIQLCHFAIKSFCLGLKISHTVKLSPFMRLQLGHNSS